MKKTLRTHPPLSPDAFRATPKYPFVIVLDNIRSAHNVGAAFRLSDAFLLSHIYLCGISATPPHPQIYKTALGAESMVPWTYARETKALVQQLKQTQYQIIAVERAVTSTKLLELHQNIANDQTKAFIFGNEVFGIQDNVLALADFCVEIPQYGSKFSMNVAMSMGIVLWEAIRSSTSSIKS